MSNEPLRPTLIISELHMTNVCVCEGSFSPCSLFLQIIAKFVPDYMYCYPRWQYFHSHLRERLESQIAQPLSSPTIRFHRLISRPGIARISQLVQRGYELDDPGLESRFDQDIILFSKASRPDRLLFRGYQASFLEVMRPEREADHIPVCSARLKMSGTLYTLLRY
jgi:hypothetical protein